MKAIYIKETNDYLVKGEEYEVESAASAINGEPLFIVTDSKGAVIIAPKEWFQITKS